MTTRRTFLKTLLGAGIGYFYFRYLPFVEKGTNPEIPPTSPTSRSPVVRAEMTQHLNPSARADPDPDPAPTPVSTGSALPNSLVYTVTPTYDRLGQAVHPSVIDFKTEFGLESWGGFRYWMAFTPYPDFNYTHENPSLLVSTDGLSWHNPPGMKNPIVPEPLVSIFAIYNSDPELVYDPEQNILILYWREYQRNGYEKIWAKKISSKCKESAKILCFENKWQRGGSLVLSPTVWRRSPNQWYMWTTNGDTLMHLSRSTDGITWSTREPCSSPWNTWNGGYIPWHVAAKPDYTGQKIDFLIAGWPVKGTLNNCELFYATAPMSQPASLSMPFQEPVLKAGHKERWDDGFIYRSSFVREAGDNPNYRIWYSACSEKKAWHIGYTEGRLDKVLLSYV